MDINIINSFLFHPRKSYQKMQNNDILINIDKNVKIGIRHHMVNNISPNILFFHGNGEIGPEYDEVAQIFNNNNVNFIVSDFRGYGFSTGYPNIENTQKDAHIILEYILDFLSLKSFIGPLIIIGRSLGSVSVLELSKRYPNDFSGLIIESGFVDEKSILELIGLDIKTNYNQEDGFLHEKKIKKYSGPLLVIHAEEDHIIPFEQAKKIISLSGSKNKKLISIPNANHNNILNINADLYFNEITKFILNLN